MGRRKLQIRKFDLPSMVIYELEGFSLVFDKKRKVLSGYSLFPSKELLKGLGVSLEGFFKMTLPRTEERLRKEPSVNRVKAAFKSLRDTVNSSKIVRRA